MVHPADGLSRSSVELVGDGVEVTFVVLGEVGALGDGSFRLRTDAPVESVIAEYRAACATSRGDC